MVGCGLILGNQALPDMSQQSAGHSRLIRRLAGEDPDGWLRRPKMGQLIIIYALSINRLLGLLLFWLLSPATLEEPRYAWLACSRSLGDAFNDSQ